MTNEDRLENVSANLDFWAMVQMARERVPERVPEANVGSNQLIISLDRAARLVAGDIEDRVHRKRGHSWTSFRFLFALWMYGELTSNQTATVTGMTRPQVSNLTQSFGKEGLVLKRRSETDGRSVVLSLSGEGEKLIEQVFLEQNQVESEWANGLTDIERDLLIALLDKLLSSEKGMESRRKSVEH